MTTALQLVQAEVDRLQAAADKAVADLAAAKAKLAATHPTLLAALERPVEDVIAFIRSFGPAFFPKAAPAPATADTDSASAAPAAQ